MRADQVSGIMAWACPCIYLPAVTEPEWAKEIERSIEVNHPLPWSRGTPEAEDFKRTLKALKAWELRENLQALKERLRISGRDPDERSMRREFNQKLELIYDEMDRRGYEYDL
jgi:hypothetical protein